MKKLVLKSIVFSLIGLISLACNIKDINLESNLNKAINENDEMEKGLNSDTLNYFSFVIPEETQITEYDDHIDFKLPNGYMAYGVDENGNYQALSIGSITCTCKSGSGGCSPGKVGGQVACVMKDCNTCEKSGTSLSGGVRLTDLIIVNLEEAPVNFISEIRDLEDRIVLPSEFLNLDIIENVLIELEENLIQSNSSETKIIPIEIYGYIVMIEVPADIDNTSIYISGGKESCGCNSGGNCPKNKKLIAVWCDATNCQSCTMSGTFTTPDGNFNYNFDVRNNRIVIN